MVAVRLSRFSAEVLGTERDRLSVTRVSAHAAALHAEEAARVRASRFSAEVLADQDSAEIVDVTRVNAHVGALYADGSAPVALSRLSAEVLADSPIIVGVTRVNAHSAAVYSQGAARIRITRFSAEVLGRASSSIVYPQEFVSGSDVFFHNWEETCQVTTSFRTVPSTSPDTGAESRRGLAARPVRVVAAQFLVNGATHLKRVKMFIRKVTTGYFHFPLYPDQAVLAADYDTSATFLAFTTGTGRWFRGARVAVVRIGSDGCEGEVTYHTIASKNLLGITLASAIGTAAPEGSVVFPLLDVHPLLEPSIEMVTDGVYRVRIEGLEISGPSALPQISDEIDPEAPEHDGLPIWNVSPDWSFPVSSFRSRDGEVTDIGRSPVYTLNATRSRQGFGFRIMGTREDTFSVLRLFEFLRGRLCPFWFIDIDTYEPIIAIDEDGDFVGFRINGSMADLSAEHDHVGLLFDDGSAYVRETVTFQDITTVYRATVTPPLPVNLDPDRLVLGSRARKVRFASDALTEDWSTDGVVAMSIRVIELLDEDVHAT